MAHDGQIVADEQQRESEVAAEVGEQTHDLRLDRDVERADRLVGDKEIRSGRQRARDADALALAAGKLVRKPLGVLTDRARRAPAARRRVGDARAGATRSWIASPSAICAPTRRRGSRLPNGSWNTICMRRRSRRHSPRDASAQRSAIEADVALARRRCRPSIRRPSVLLPEPDSPTTPTPSPRATAERRPRAPPAPRRLACEQARRIRKSSTGRVASTRASGRSSCRGALRAASSRQRTQRVTPIAARLLERDRRRPADVAACAQRGAKRQPAGKACGCGTTPGMPTGASSPSGAASSSARV